MAVGMETLFNGGYSALNGTELFNSIELNECEINETKSQYKYEGFQGFAACMKAVAKYVGKFFVAMATCKKWAAYPEWPGLFWAKKDVTIAKKNIIATGNDLNTLLPFAVQATNKDLTVETHDAIVESVTDQVNAECNKLNGVVVEKYTVTIEMADDRKASIKATFLKAGAGLEGPELANETVTVLVEALKA